MATKKTTKSSETKAKVKVSPAVKEATKENATANQELVNEASIDVKIAKAPKKNPAARFVSSDVVIVNTSQNTILLRGNEKDQTFLIAPKEIKRINRSFLKTLLKNKVVQAWFDKGILTSNMDENETSANEAQAPAHLSAPVERHDGASVSASVTKFEKEGTVSINL